MKLKRLLSIGILVSLTVLLGWAKADNIYDNYGFNERGIHKMTNTEYDEHGFDACGINKDTKKEYDEYGFKRDGINILTNTKYSRGGYDIDGMDRFGYHRYHNFKGSGARKHNF
jgi:hypothetical protein